MNQLLFDRLTGDLGPQAFGRIQTSQLLHAIQPAPRLRFDGGEQELVPSTAPGNLDPQKSEAERKLWSHQAGVNALSIDIDGRMYCTRWLLHRGALLTQISLVSGGADSSIKLWDLEQISPGAVHIFRPTGMVAR